MKAWVVTTGEPLPGDGGARLFRTGLLATTLSRQGHEVVWWTSTFNHVAKNHRARADKTMTVNAGLQIRQLFSPGYRSNLSLQRILDHRVMALRFAAAAAREERPDVVICSLPTLELSVSATAYGRRAGVPVVLDVRDLWPDLQVALLPRPLRPIGWVAALPMVLQARRACRDAAAITGVTKGFVRWALRHAGRDATDLDRPFPMGYPAAVPDATALAEADTFWRSRDIVPESREFVVCFAGTIGHLFELEPVIRAARQLEADGRGFRFVICGSGDRLAAHQAMAEGCRSVLFTGWVDAAKIWTLMRRSNVGIAPYFHTPNFVLNIPNKPIEYLSAGLPILTNLSGELRDLITEHDCGITYESRNVGSLVSALTTLASSSERLRQMADNAARLYASSLTAEGVYDAMGRYLQLVADAASTCRRGDKSTVNSRRLPVTSE